MPMYRFTGKELDPETGLYYYGARYYDPVLSRWISADPILAAYLDGKPNEGIYAPINLGLFIYTRNNPVVFIDPTGMFDEITGTIEKGDTLTSIKNSLNESRTQGLTVNELGKFNNIQDINKIYAGDNLLIPADNQPGPDPSSGRTFGSGIPQTGADCHMGERSGLNFPLDSDRLPAISFGPSVTLPFTAFDSYSFMSRGEGIQKSKSPGTFIGTSFGTTFGRAGELELGGGVGRHMSIGLNFERNIETGQLRQSGITLNIGVQWPPTLGYGVVTPKKK